MQANWSLILNVLLLIGVVVAIGRLMKARRHSLTPVSYQPSLSQEEAAFFDDIIAVRKLSEELPDSAPVLSPLHAQEVMEVPVEDEPEILIEAEAADEKNNTVIDNESGRSLMIFLLAKENRQLAGYELLQTILATGLRFGEGNLFHRHQYPNGQGPILCSLAAATATGVFDLQNIGMFSIRGLCLFMQTSGNGTIDIERFNIMLETARQLSEGLDCFLLDEKKRPLTDENLSTYYQILGH